MADTSGGETRDEAGEGEEVGVSWGGWLLFGWLVAPRGEI